MGGAMLVLLAPLIRGERERQRPRHLAKPCLVQRPVQFALVALQQRQGFCPLSYNTHLPGFLALADADFHPAEFNRVKGYGQCLISTTKGERDKHRGKLAGWQGRGQFTRAGA